MTPGGVMDAIIADPRHPRWRTPSLQSDGSIDFSQDPRQGDDILLWGWLMQRMRPNREHHMPLSPEEAARAISMLKVVLDALLTEKARHPVHLAAVTEGGR
jgi:hypothetical protein